MRNPKQAICSILATGALSANLLLSAGCQEAATAAAVTEAAQVTAAAVAQIPDWLQNAADSLLAQNKKTDWGKPEKVIITDTHYVLLYPTSKAELKRNNNVPRMLVIIRPYGDAEQKLY